MTTSTAMDTVSTVRVALIERDPDQPRFIFNEAAHMALVESIRSEGLLQPIAVRRVDDRLGAGATEPRFVIVYGERRFRAVQELGWDEIPAVELSRDNYVDVLVTQLVENLTRTDLHPVEEAHAYQRLIDAGMKATDVAERIGKSKSYISHKLSLLGLPDPLGIFLERGLLSEGQVRQLARLKGVYGTRTITYKEASKLLEEVDEWPDCVVIPAAFMSWRPLDWPCGYGFPAFEGEIAETIARSARALLRLLIAEPEQPAWLVPTWWYAAQLVRHETSTVNDARTLVEAHIEHISSAMVMVLLMGEDPSNWPDHDGWLYCSDLRHAGFEHDLDSVKDWLRDHLDVVENAVSETGPGLLLPSARQPGAPQWVAGGAS